MDIGLIFSTVSPAFKFSDDWDHVTHYIFRVGSSSGHPHSLRNFVPFPLYWKRPALRSPYLALIPCNTVTCHFDYRLPPFGEELVSIVDNTLHCHRFEYVSTFFYSLGILEAQVLHLVNTPSFCWILATSQHLWFSRNPFSLVLYYLNLAPWGVPRFFRYETRGL